MSSEGFSKQYRSMKMLRVTRRVVLKFKVVGLFL
jgi:hypothetical protein